jgi:hypothetical protein
MIQQFFGYNLYRVHSYFNNWADLLNSVAVKSNCKQFQFEKNMIINKIELLIVILNLLIISIVFTIDLLRKRINYCFLVYLLKIIEICQKK